MTTNQNPPPKSSSSSSIIESNQKELDELKAKLEAPNNEYAKAEADFQDIDQQLNQKKESLRKAQDAGMIDQAEAILKEIDGLSQTWKLAKDRFDLSIRERKTINERVDILQKSLVTDQLSLNKLLGDNTKTDTPASPENPNTTSLPPNQPRWRQNHHRRLTAGPDRVLHHPLPDRRSGRREKLVRRARAPKDVINQMLKKVYDVGVPVNLHCNGDGAIDLPDRGARIRSAMAT